MPKTANINVRIDPDFKAKVEDLYASFGLSLTDAINIFLHVSLMEGGLPFDLKQPRYNAETEKAMAEAKDILNGKISAKHYHSVDDAFDNILSEDDLHA